MPTVEGRITIVQEQRFRLATEGGQVLLLTLPDKVSISLDDLARLRDSAAIVRVTYAGDPNTTSAAVQAVELA